MVFIPPIDGIIEGEDSLFDEVWILGGELFGIVATLDVLGTKIVINANISVCSATASLKMNSGERERF